jgi:Protein of unknown function (DUF2975)
MPGRIARLATAKSGTPWFVLSVFSSTYSRPKITLADKRLISYCLSILNVSQINMRPSTALVATSITLQILIVLNWILGALIFALLAISFMAEEWTWRALGVGASIGHEGLVAGMRAIMVIGIAGTPIAFLVFSRLLRTVESVRAGEPFTVDNARRLRTIAWALLGLELLHICVVAIASAISTKEAPLCITGNFDLTGWLAILLLFVLAQVFLEGTRMREDLEGTV